MPLIRIKHRYTDAILHETEAKDLREALEEACNTGANLAGANLAGANLAGANLTSAYLAHANLAGADFTGANLTGADFTGADLTSAYLAGANLAGANLAGAYLTSAYLAHANLAGADFTGAYLTSVYLAHANLTGADFTSANLTSANLASAYLTSAYLAGANLTGANLTGAYLTSANLAGANLTGAYLAGGEGIDPRLVNPLLALFLQPGKIRSFKLINSFGEGPVKGGITYEIGKSYEVAKYNTDPFADCGAGINLGTLPWCMQAWREGYRILIAEHTAADIVAVPWFFVDKYRVKRCTIVGEVEL